MKGAHRMASIGRDQIADHIHERLSSERETLTAAFNQPGRIRSCAVDDLLPEPMARAIYEAFPEESAMTYNRTLRERKYVAVQMNRYPPILEEAIYAFQDRRVVADVENITGLPGLEPDEHLYAGGLSAMAKGNFLNPHLDNSHDKNRDRYRVLNLLYYVTPDWRSEYGGNLELWDDGPEKEPRAFESRFNRLVLMVTDRQSWHSVNEVVHDGRRCCVSNYYFSKQPADAENYFHVTSFRGRPEQPLRDIALRADGAARMGLRRLFKKGIRENPHVYKKDDPGAG